MKYRHEWKHDISYADMLTLRTRLSAVMQTDDHVVGDTYQVRSLYFDNASNKALYEKIDGVNMREKFRIRLYNNDTSYICLEKKSKINGLCLKEKSLLSKEEAQKIVDGDIAWMKATDRPLCQELYSKMLSQGLKPKTIVEYTRKPFVYPAGNVRVTLDYNIRTGFYGTDFLNSETLLLPAAKDTIILEVKWDEFLPDIIKDAVTIPGRRAAAFSKYQQGRIYG